MNSIILFLSDEAINATRVAGLPKQIHLHNEVYSESNEVLGDYDYVRNADDELIGFAFSAQDYELKLVSPLISVAKNIRVESGHIFFMLSPSETFKINTLQASSWLYRNAAGKILIGLHEWSDLGKIKFTLFQDVAESL